MASLKKWVEIKSKGAYFFVKSLEVTQLNKNVHSKFMSTHCLIQLARK